MIDHKFISSYLIRLYIKILSTSKHIFRNANVFATKSFKKTFDAYGLEMDPHCVNYTFGDKMWG